MGRRKSGEGRFGLLGGIVAIALTLAVIGGLYYAASAENVAEARHWTIEGPPCAPAARQSFYAQREGAAQKVIYSGTLFAWQENHVSCADVHDHGGWGFGHVTVCQFSSPRAVIVRTGKSEAFYVLQPAKPVTITLERGRLSCVYGTSEWDAM